ncbi:MAG: ABC transporter ATP-binding protein [Eubacteriales bacterium]
MILSIFKRLLSLFSKKQKGTIVVLILMIFISGLLETVGVSLILPLLTAILDKDAFAQTEYVVRAMELLHIQEVDTFILCLIGLLIGIYIIKNVYLVFCAYVQAKFVSRNKSRAMKNLLSQYLHRPYEYYFHADSATILRTIYSDMENVFNMVLLSFNFIAEAVVCASLCLVLLIMDIRMCLLMVVLLSGTTILVVKNIKPRLNQVGQRSMDKLARIYKEILRAIEGVKDIKVFHKEQFFLDGFTDTTSQYAKYQIKNNVLSIIPRQLIETVAIVGILAYVAFSLITGVDTAVLMGLVGAFSVAAMRLLPSVNRLNTHLANLSFFEASLQNVCGHINMEEVRHQEFLEVEAEHTQEEPDIAIEHAITLTNITYRYPQTETYIFRNADMIIPKGKSVGVVGSSGSGKTTIIDILLGLLDVEEGVVESDGVPIKTSYAKWLSNIGYIPQSIYMLDGTICQNIAFGVEPEAVSIERVWQVLGDAQIKEFVESLPNGLDEEISERGIRLSGGQRQRLGIARALYHNPELLVFDEATSALDNETERALMEAIESLQGQKTMVIIAHRLKTIENCDMIYEVKEEKITRTK